MAWSSRLVAGANKGFGSQTETQSESNSSKQQPEAAQSDAIEVLEARMRSRRSKRVEAKVKVESGTVDAVQGRSEITPEQKAEGNFVLAMLSLFVLVMAEGLLIAGSGFLPEDWDAFIEDSLYPNYTGLVALFLASSTAYGLWKIGKLPLPFLGAPPPQSKD